MLRGWDFEFSWDYNWIIKVWGVAIVWPLGCWGHCTQEVLVGLS